MAIFNSYVSHHPRGSVLSLQLFRALAEPRSARCQAWNMCEPTRFNWRSNALHFGKEVPISLRYPPAVECGKAEKYSIIGEFI